MLTGPWEPREEREKKKKKNRKKRMSDELFFPMFFPAFFFSSFFFSFFPLFSVSCFFLFFSLVLRTLFFSLYDFPYSPTDSVFGLLGHRYEWPTALSLVCSLLSSDLVLLCPILYFCLCFWTSGIPTSRWSAVSAPDLLVALWPVFFLAP